MENDQGYAENTHSTDTNLALTEAAKYYLLISSKWTKFLSILGFILSGVVAIFAIFANTLLSNLGTYGGVFGTVAGLGALYTVVYFIMAALYFFPSLYLFKFSKGIKEALYSDDDQLLEEALKNQKSLFKFWGIFAIVILSIYLLIGIFAFLGSLFF